MCIYTQTLTISILSSFDIELTLDVSTLGLSKADRLKYGESLMTHAMVFTGVQLKVNNL